MRVEVVGGHSTFRPGDRIDVLCHLDAPDGTAMPLKVGVRIIDRKNREMQHRVARPRPDDGSGHLVLEVQLPAPKEPGTYEIQAQAVDAVFSDDSGGANPGSMRVTRSPGIRVTVK